MIRDVTALMTAVMISRTYAYHLVSGQYDSIVSVRDSHTLKR